MTLANCFELALLTGFALFGSVTPTMAQDKGRARDLQNACQVSDIPALDQLSLTWTGDCVDGKASGVGTVLAFSRGELRYILRGQFTDGRLMRRDQMRSCAEESCTDQVAAAVLRAHAALSHPTQTPGLPTVAVAGIAPGKADIRAEDALYRGNFVVDAKTHAVSGDGRVEFIDGRVYVGALEGGRRAGRGTYVWSNGERYVGGWRNDLQEGRGEWTSPKGDRYVGEHRLGKREGKGVMTYANTMQYDGEWLADQPSGAGIFRFQNGDVYEGQFVAGEQAGAGTLIHKNGDRYTGQWQHGLRHGKGVAEWKDRQRYEGNWRGDRKEGLGIMRFPDGGTYDGQWKDDQATGQGNILFASGDSYAGEVLDGLPHGKGMYKWGSGDRFEGEFNAGKPTTNGVMTFHVEETTPTAREGAVIPAVASDVAVGADGPAALSRVTLCSRGYNAARSVNALRRFIESFPEDECARHALARQKITALEENERKTAREQLERQAQAKALIGLVVVYRQEYPFCVSGTGSSCQQVVYLFEVKGKIKDVSLTRQGVQVQVVEVVALANEKGASAKLYAEGRAAAIDSFRRQMLGTSPWKTKTDVGLAF